MKINSKMLVLVVTGILDGTFCVEHDSQKMFTLTNAQDVLW